MLTWPSPKRLDLQPVALALPERADVLWEDDIDFHPGGRTRLLGLGTGALLQDGERGVWRASGSPLSQWTHHALELAHLGTGVEGPPFLLDRSGALFRWRGSEAPEPVWELDAPAADAVVDGVEAGSALVRRLGATGGCELVDLAARTVRWRREDAPTFVVPHEGVLLCLFAARPDRIEALDLDSGEARWVRAPPGAGPLVILGAAADRAWIGRWGLGPGQPASLCALDLETGAGAGEIRLDGIAAPEGVLDPSGCLHVWNGISYRRVSLESSSVEVAATVPGGVGAPSTVSAANTLLGSDGRLVCLDDRGRIFALPPDSPGEPVQLQDLGSRQVGLVAVDGRLLTLGATGHVTCLGDG